MCLFIYGSIRKNITLTRESFRPAADSLGYMEWETVDEKKEKLLSCIGELDEKEKDVIIRRYYYEQKPAEIATALDIPKKQVENRLYRVKRKLRRLMEA